MVKVYLVDGKMKERVDLPRLPVPGEIFHFYGRQPELDCSGKVKAVVYNMDTYRSKETRSGITKGSKLEILVILEPTNKQESELVVSST